IIYLVKIIQDWNAIDKAIIQQIRDVLLVQLSLEAVADDKGLFGDLPLFVKLADQRDVKSGRGFDMDVVVQCLVQYEAEMGRLGAITIGVFSFVIMRLYGIVEVS